MIRSFRVTEKFTKKLNYLQEKNKVEGITKTQEQLFDEMINLYMLYYQEDRELFYNAEIEKQLVNVNELFLIKQAKLINALIDKIDKEFNSLKK